MKFLPIEGFPFQIHIFSYEEYVRAAKRRKHNVEELLADGCCYHSDGLTVICIKEETYNTVDHYQRIQMCYHEATHAVQHFLVVSTNEKLVQNIKRT